MVKFTDPCPTCFIEKGYSVVMTEENGVYQCPRISEHKYKKNEQGYFERI